MQLSDADLWEAFRQGDAEAFEVMYRRFAPELLTYGHRVTSDRQLVKDSIQTLFLHIWERRTNLSPTDSIKFYLFRALRNSITQAKRRATEPLDLEEWDGLTDSALLERSIEQIFVQNELYEEQVQTITSAIRSLSERQQEVIQLRYFHNLNSAEIAALLKISNQSARNLLHRSIVQLRVFLADLPKSWISSLSFFFFS